MWGDSLVGSRLNTGKQGKKIAYLNAAMNIILAVGKGFVGVIGHSDALIADAVHSAADLIGSLAVIVGLRIAEKPPDEDHPYGHGKAELIASIIVAGFLVAASVEVGYSSAVSIVHKPTTPQVIAAYAAFGAIVIKEILYRFNMRIGKRLSSKSLVASAYDHRSDVYSSLAALIGISLAIIGDHYHVFWLRYMDGVAGVFVAMLVFKIAIDIARDSLNSLMDRVVLEEENLSPYRELAEQVEGVRRVDGIRVRDHGQYVIVDLEIGVDANITVAAGHDIAAEVRSVMREQMARIQDVFVHVNPYYGESRERIGSQ